MTEANGAQESRKLGLLTIPGIVVSLLSRLTCPLCWPAYTDLLQTLTDGFRFLGELARAGKIAQARFVARRE